MPKLKVYTASKLAHAPLWKQLANDENWNNIEFTARWPFLHVGTVPDEPCYAKVFWQHDLEDVAASDLVLCYAEPGDQLRGALVESGMAIALGKAVIACGPEDHPCFGTWVYHPLVYRVADLNGARMLLVCMQMVQWAKGIT